MIQLIGKKCFSHLVERPQEKIYGSEGSQTAAFKQRPPSPPFIPKKTGVDVSTHIEEGELFNFDVEVTPLLDVSTFLYSRFNVP